MRIVALHGQLGMASDWDGLAGRSAEHELDAVDLWSYLSDGELAMEAFGEKLNADQESGQILLGYSMGGRLALHALIGDPAKWKAAVIISAHVGLSAEDRIARKIVDGEWADKVENLSWVEFLDEWNEQGVLGNDVMPDRALLERSRTEIYRSFRCWSLAEQEDLLEKLSGVEIPVLWVVGERDEKFCKQGERAVRMLKNAKLLRIPSSGHRVPWEAEGEIANELSQWMCSLD